MSHRSVETLIGRLVTDPALRRRFEESPAATIVHFRSQGFELTRIEIEALAAMDAAAIGRFAAGLDTRIRKTDTKSGLE
jgi:hypothetical protein